MGGHFKDPTNPPLQPKFYKEVPQWFPRIWPWPINKEYTGRDAWWAEAGYVDPYLSRGLMSIRHAEYYEQDNNWWDEKVPDGTSIAGPMGQDSVFYRNYIVKADQPANFFEFQKKLMTNCSQYRQIADNWELSKEHPGMKVNPKLDSIDHYSRFTLSKYDFHPTLNHYGPRFWDKPINEGCFEKGLCLAKYATLGAIFHTYSKIKGEGIMVQGEWTWKGFFRLAVPNIPFPSALAFTYGFSLCAASKVRNVDDMWNFVIAAGSLCFVYASITNKVYVATTTFFPLLAFFGSVFHISRCMPHGLSGDLMHQANAGYHTSGPFGYKHFRFGKLKEPDPKDYLS